MVTAVGRTDESETGWHNRMLGRFFDAMHITVADNREPEASYLSEGFHFDQHSRFLTFFERNFERFFASRSLLEDEVSRQWFDDLILFNLVGYLHHRLPTNCPEHFEARRHAEALAYADCADYPGMLPLRYHRVFGPTGHPIELMCWSANVAWTFFFKQYFYNRDGVSVAPSIGDIIIDAGACFGDTAICFADAVGPTGHVHAFEFVPIHLEIIRKNLQLNPVLSDRITVHSVAMGTVDSEPQREVAWQREVSPGQVLDATCTPIRSIDSLVSSGEIQRIDFIKLDVEGSELSVLKGAENALRCFRPKIAVSLYHHIDDFIAIPKWLADLGLSYRFYLDHYTIYNEETVLYCVPSSCI